MRYRVLQIYKNRSAGNTLDFLNKVLEQLPFPVQRIQTDRRDGAFSGEGSTAAYEVWHKIPPQ